MTIRCDLHDAGTMLIKVPHESPPGMDLAYFRELNMEYDWPQERTGEISSLIRGVEHRVDLAPWPDKFPGNMWVDWGKRHYADQGGPKFEMYYYDLYSKEWGPVPSSLSQVTYAQDLEPGVRRLDERASDLLTQEEVSAREPEPTKWIRLPTKNESGGCELETPVILSQRAHTGAAYTLTGDYNPIYMPFDLREPDYYRMIDDDGNGMSDRKKENYMKLMADGHYRLYLAPAKWRWVATVVATYLYVSWFEMFYTDLIFTRAWFNRPPIYPWRHEVLQSAGRQDIEYNHAYYAMDIGIDDGLERSRGAADLRRQIIDAQWWTQSEAFIFSGNDPLTLTIWQHPPDPGDVVLGIGRVDYPSKREDRVWLIQKEDVSSRWPNTVVGHYLLLTFQV